MSQPYVLRSPEEFDESVQIGNEIVPVTLDPTRDAAEFQALFLKLQSAQVECRKPDMTAEDIAALNAKCGEYITTLMALIFGTDGADKIIAFYHDNYTRLIFAIIPFIRDRIKPMLDRYVADLRKSYKSATRR